MPPGDRVAGGHHDGDHLRADVENFRNPPSLPTRSCPSSTSSHQPSSGTQTGGPGVYLRNFY
jgi:hypothetical protein